jgi:hypothetical protein
LRSRNKNPRLPEVSFSWLTSVARLLRDYADQSGHESNYLEVKRAREKIDQLVQCEEMRNIDKMETAQRQELKEVENLQR